MATQVSQVPQVPQSPSTPPPPPAQLFIPPLHLSHAAASSNSSLLAIPNMDFGGDLTEDLFKQGATPMRERATHVIQLSEEKQKLEEELRLMDERLKRAEQRSEQLKRGLVKDDGPSQANVNGGGVSSGSNVRN